MTRLSPAATEGASVTDTALNWLPLTDEPPPARFNEALNKAAAAGLEFGGCVTLNAYDTDDKILVSVSVFPVDLDLDVEDGLRLVGVMSFYDDDDIWVSRPVEALVELDDLCGPEGGVR